MPCDCLVLDQNWKPVDFCCWQNAIKLVWEDRAQIIKEDLSGRKLHSPSITMGFPRVVVVRNSWSRRKRDMIPLSRRNVYLRDNGDCQYCGNKLGLAEYTIDHVIPQCKNGQDTWENLVLACQKCNKYKSGYTLKESGMNLKRVPVRPKNDDPRFNFKLHVHNLRPEWEPWKDLLYYTVSN